MVKVTPHGLRIEIATPNPASSYVELQRDIISLLQSADPELRADENYYYLLEMLKSMLPDTGQATQMLFEEME